MGTETTLPPDPAAAPVGEAAALESLKTRINDDSSRPPLDIARSLQAHLNTFPQTPADLGGKLGKSRSWVIQLTGFLKLPPEVLAKAEAEGAGFKDLQALYAAYRDANNENNNANTSANSSTGASVSANNENNAANIPANTPANRLSGEYPLLRDTVNVFARVLFFWAKDSNLGEVAERWAIRLSEIGWVWSFLRLAVIILAVYGAWHLQAVLRPDIRHLWTLVRTGFSDKGLMSAPTPVHLTGSRWISGHRLELRWEPAGAGYSYRVYWNSPDGRTIDPVAGDVFTPGAIVNCSYQEIRKHGFLSVTAISPNQEESAPSQRVPFDLTSVNDRDEVEPLPQQGTGVVRTQSAEGRNGKKAATSPTAAPATPAFVLTPPVEVHAEVKTPDLIRITWRAVGPDVRYNVYSSASRELTNLRKENDHPFKLNVATWSPETGLERYWIVVTSLDAQDHESTYSEAIEVIRHPEKSGKPDASDAAADVLRKILPW